VGIQTFDEGVEAEMCERTASQGKPKRQERHLAA
jgi:hypothetical protein